MRDGSLAFAAGEKEGARIAMTPVWRNGMRYLVLLTLLCSSLAVGAAREVDEYHREGVDRIVAIGDLHGDFDNYLGTLQAAGLADSKGKWTGGSAHLVQTGDIPDRGPDTGRIIEHIIKLDKQARRNGRRVHNLPAAARAERAGAFRGAARRFS